MAEDAWSLQALGCAPAVAQPRTYWRIETQAEGIRDFYRVKDACEYAYNAPLILRIEERHAGDQADDPPLRRVDILDFGDICGGYWPD